MGNVLPQVGVIWITTEGQTDLEINQVDAAYALKTTEMESSFSQFNDLIDQVMVILRQTN